MALEASSVYLHQALSAGDIDEVRRIIGNNPAAIAQFIAAPTKLEQHTVYPMADNGSAMSPFYTSLCLWIGAIFMVALMSVTVSPARQQALARKLGRAPRPAEPEAKCNSLPLTKIRGSGSCPRVEGSATPRCLPSLLLRSESAASSQIENLTSSARNIALAEPQMP